MICPNCKTELVEVNGRYICSDCGREIPENEVMASDWGNGGNTRAGLYGAGSDDHPEEGSKPISDYSASLSETENELAPVAPVVDVPVAITPPEVPALSVEEILQEQATVATPDQGFYTPPVEVAPVVVAPLSAEPEPIPESSYTPPEVPLEVVAPVAEQTIPITIPEVTPALEPEPTPEPVFTPPVAPIEAAIPDPVPEVAPVLESEPALEPAPVQEQVVTDMFESAYTSPVTNDPGIYTDPMYEASQASQQSAMTNGVTRAPMPADKKTTMIVLISGIALTLLLVVGGIWAFVSLTAKVQPVVTPVVDEVSWQELQVVDGGFKLSLPGAPDKTEELAMFNGVQNTLTTYAVYAGDASYTVSFAPLESSQQKAISDNLPNSLPTLVEEIATTKGLKVESVKIGKYYAADAIDFTLSSDTGKYQGKLMLSESSVIIVMAGSDSGQSVEYDKFIKSFAFIELGATE